MKNFFGCQFFSWVSLLLFLTLGCQHERSQDPSDGEVVKSHTDEFPIPAVSFIATDPEDQEIEAIEAFEDKEGRINLEYDSSYKCAICETVSKRPAENPKLLYDCPNCEKSIHMHPRAVALEFKHNREIADEDLAYLAGLPHLEELDLSSQPVTDRIISLLVQLKHLELP